MLRRLTTSLCCFVPLPEQYRDQLVWSTGPSTLLTGFHSFDIYELKICGVNMFQNLTSSWHALVDTGSSCLGLPAEFFDMVISWLPMTCNLGRVDGLPHVCYLSGDVKQRVLPTLSFKLAAGGSDLFINLSDLLFNQGAAGVDPANYRFCLYRSSSLTQGANQGNSIAFGGRVIKQFFAAFDMSAEGKVGFANKLPLVESRVQCAARVMCDGMEVHYDQLNICLPPPCSDYYFFELDESSKQCKLVSKRHKSMGRER